MDDTKPPASILDFINHPGPFAPQGAEDPKDFVGHLEADGSVTVEPVSELAKEWVREQAERSA